MGIKDEEGIIEEVRVLLKENPAVERIVAVVEESLQRHLSQSRKFCIVEYA